MQRERTRNLTLKEIENYFHLPIQEAAKKMEFSATVVKKICRKYGVTRWPHRKVFSWILLLHIRTSVLKSVRR